MEQNNPTSKQDENRNPDGTFKVGNNANPEGKGGLQVGHYISRDIKQLRWNPKNVHPQCSRCNWEHNKNPIPYTQFMLKTYGQGVLDELNEIRRKAKAEVKPLKAWQLEELYNEQNK